MEPLHWRKQRLDTTERALIMGILNVTPDSFSDGGQHDDVERALAWAQTMMEEGADILDIGGESTRPGAPPVPAAEECRRVAPVIERLRAISTIPISIDTTKAEVARAALEAGADAVNDVSGFRRDAELKHVAADFGAGCVAMHMRGTPATMQQLTDYDDLPGEIDAYFAATLELLDEAGVPPEAVALDPGIGFGKTAEQNLVLIDHLDVFGHFGRPLLLGTSRKSFIGKTLGIDAPERRHWGTAATVAVGILRGARILRVHDVGPMHQVARMTEAILHA